jgi:hypothetical protein
MSINLPPPGRAQSSVQSRLMLTVPG